MFHATRKLRRPDHLRPAAQTPAQAMPSAPTSGEAAQGQRTRAIEGLAPRRRTDTPQAHSSAPRLGLLGRYAARSAFGPEADRRNVPAQLRARIGMGMTAGDIRAVTIPGPAGTLHGYFHPPSPQVKDTKKIVLFLSGSGAPVETLGLDIARKYQQHGIGVLTVNYRGFGKSTGPLHEEGLYEDARAMLAHLRNAAEPQARDADIVLHGYSMGAPIAARLAGELQEAGREIGGLILDRPMPSMSKAVVAHSVPGWGQVAGQIAKTALGTMSVEKNLRSLPAGKKVFLITDNSGLGRHGEQLRERLQAQGLVLAGKHVDAPHEDSDFVMKTQIGALRRFLVESVHRRSGHRSKLSTDLPASALLSAVETDQQDALRKLEGRPVPPRQHLHGTSLEAPPVAHGGLDGGTAHEKTQPALEETDEAFWAYARRVVNTFG